jgi:hypothetical protein
MNNASATNDVTTAPRAKPMARSVATSRERSDTAEYMVLSAPKTAPMPITTATRVPRPRMRLVSMRDDFA